MLKKFHLNQLNQSVDVCLVFMTFYGSDPTKKGRIRPDPDPQH